MTEHPNTILVRQMVAAFQAGNLGTVGGFFAADALWDLPGRSAVAGTYKGPAEIVGFLAKAYELSGGSLRLDVIDILGSDWGAVQVQHVTAQAPDAVSPTAIWTRQNKPDLCNRSADACSP